MYNRKMSTFTSQSKIRLNNKKTPQYISKKGISSVDNLGDMCTRNPYCPIANTLIMATHSHIAKIRF